MAPTGRVPELDGADARNERIERLLPPWSGFLEAPEVQPS
jgi:hypothetical protein